MKTITKFCALLALACILAPFMWSQPTVTSISPTPGSHDNPTTAKIAATFSETMQDATAATMPVHAGFTGLPSGSYGNSATTLRFTPAEAFKPGERVEFTLTDGLQSGAGANLAAPGVYRFRAAAGAGPGTFGNVPCTPASSGCHAVKLGDVDGDLDAVTTGNVYANDGSGNFTALTTFGGGLDIWDIDLGDVDGDGDLDIVGAVGDIASIDYAWLNDGSGHFTASTSFGFATEYSYAIRLGDMDGDGDLDAVVGNRNNLNSPAGAQNFVYLNDGSGNFGSPVNLGPGDDVTKALALGDFDNDGDLDVAVGNGDISGAPNFVYLNNGGSFSSGIPLLGAQTWPRAELTWYLDTGDFNGDGKLDIVCGNFGLTGASNVVYFGDGAGNFDAGETVLPGVFPTMTVRFGDMDGDGDLDVISGNTANQPSYVQFNDGSGGIASSVAYSSTPTTWGLDVGDLDGDGDLDLFEGDDAANHAVHLNGQTAPTITVTSNGYRLANGGYLNVAPADSLTDLGLAITVDDGNGDNVALTGTVSGITTQGILNSEFSSSTAGTPYTLYPSTGTFTVAGATHTVTLTADDGSGELTHFSFNIMVGSTPPATCYVFETDGNGAVITNGAAAAGLRDFGSVALGNSSGALTIYILNGGGQALHLGTPTVAGAAASDYVIDTTGFTPTLTAAQSTTFTIRFAPTAVGSRPATISFAHDAPAESNPFSFGVTGVGDTGSNPGGSGDGGGTGGGGGCVAGAGGAAAWLLGLLALLAVPAACRRRA